jgi:hypothetical protein
MRLSSSEVELDGLSGRAGGDRNLSDTRGDGRGVELGLGGVYKVTARVLL